MRSKPACPSWTCSTLLPPHRPPGAATRPTPGCCGSGTRPSISRPSVSRPRSRGGTPSIRSARCPPCPSGCARGHAARCRLRRRLSGPAPGGGAAFVATWGCSTRWPRRPASSLWPARAWRRVLAEDAAADPPRHRGPRRARRGPRRGARSARRMGHRHRPGRGLAGGGRRARACRSHAKAAAWWPGSARRNAAACAQSCATPAPSCVLPGVAGPRSITVGVASLSGHRLVVVPKERPTPGSYPRPAGVRRRRKR